MNKVGGGHREDMHAIASYSYAGGCVGSTMCETKDDSRWRKAIASGDKQRVRPGNDQCCVSDYDSVMIWRLVWVIMLVDFTDRIYKAETNFLG
jgi:hypothetical protein